MGPSFLLEENSENGWCSFWICSFRIIWYCDRFFSIWTFPSSSTWTRFIFVLTFSSIWMKLFNLKQSYLWIYVFCECVFAFHKFNPTSGVFSRSDWHEITQLWCQRTSSRLGASLRSPTWTRTLLIDRPKNKTTKVSDHCALQQYHWTNPDNQNTTIPRPPAPSWPPRKHVVALRDVVWHFQLIHHLELEIGRRGLSRHVGGGA